MGNASECSVCAEQKHFVVILNHCTRISQKQHNSRRLTEESSQKRKHGHHVYIMRYATCAQYICSNPLPRNSMLTRARRSWLCAIFSFRMTPPRACSFLRNIEYWGKGVQVCERGCCVCACMLFANFLPSTVRQKGVKVLSYSDP